MMGAGNSMRWKVSSVVLPGLHMAAAAAEHIRWQVSSVLVPGLHVAAACGGVVTGTVLTAEVVPCLQHRWYRAYSTGGKKQQLLVGLPFWRISVGENGVASTVCGCLRVGLLSRLKPQLVVQRSGLPAVRFVWQALLHPVA